MTGRLTAAQLGVGAVIRRNSVMCTRKCTKKHDDGLPWEIRGYGRFANDTVDVWLAEGAWIEACCRFHGIGGHDPIEHASGEPA